MDERLTRYLDGEMGFSELPPSLREEARRWQALAAEMRDRGVGATPGGLEEGVMREVLSGPPASAAGRSGGASEAAEEEGADAGPDRASPLVRGLRWLGRPREFAFPPAVPLAAAAGLVLWLLAAPFGTGPAPGGRAGASDGSPSSPVASSTTGAAARTDARAASDAGAAPAGAARVYVEFTLEAPEAGAVAVAGDFTGWEPSVRLEDRDGDGVWSGRVPLQPGIHEYMFVVDGERWITDPHAERYSRDGFGNRNAVLTIALPSDGAGNGV